MSKPTAEELALAAIDTEFTDVIKQFVRDVKVDPAFPFAERIATATRVRAQLRCIVKKTL
ncbi:MAG: hypothetical protein KGL35_24970 [Bradyrhizobium sp.]|nr:hypothetical protein [Bradyrhizobium sp.]